MYVSILDAGHPLRRHTAGIKHKDPATDEGKIILSKTYRKKTKVATVAAGRARAARAPFSFSKVKKKRSFPPTVRFVGDAKKHMKIQGLGTMGCIL